MHELHAQNSTIQRTPDDNLATLNDMGVWSPKSIARSTRLNTLYSICSTRWISLHRDLH